tara:strand:+ start:954 stop:1244 length:291 start_codon:yes stop_codon:yes gene_type:complete
VPIIKYTVAATNGRVPSYLTDWGYFHDPRDGTFIGIGSGGGTELTKAELVTRAQGFSHVTCELNDAGDDDFSTARDVTSAEYETQVNTWCSARGIS